MTNELITKNEILNLVPSATTEELKFYPWKKGTSDEVINAQGSVLFKLDGLNAIGKRINEVMLPLIAQLNGMEVWKSLENCKSLNQLLISLGLPKSTASGLIKIATICYDSAGNIEPRYAKFNYNELQVLAQANESEREHMVEWARPLEDFSTKDFKEELKEFRNPSVDSTAVEVEDENTESTESTESSESTEKISGITLDESTESTESTAVEHGEVNTNSLAVGTTLKASHELIMNELIDLRAKIENMKKIDIAHRIDEIVVELGELSKYEEKYYILNDVVSNLVFHGENMEKNEILDKITTTWYSVL